MVQQMIDAKFNEYGLANSGTGIPTRDKHQPVSIKKTALRDLQNETRNIISNLQCDSAPMKEKGLSADAARVCGSKRIEPEGPLSSTCNPSCNNGSGGHLVYVRRKTDSEPGRTNVWNTENSRPTQSMKVAPTEVQGSSGQENKMQEPKVSCFPAFAPISVASHSAFSSGEFSLPHSVAKPDTPLSSGAPSVPHSLGPASGSTVAEPKHPMVTTGIPFRVSPQNKRAQQRQERFDQLQAFLKSCDHSNQEEYVRMLRSLSAAGRSRHAVELEKRAIRLLLEEGNPASVLSDYVLPSLMARSL